MLVGLWHVESYAGKVHGRETAWGLQLLASAFHIVSRISDSQETIMVGYAFYKFRSC